ncbi:acyltransferase family protein [Acuticoccus sediminis]|nr:acyltransferase [Acuticoccus sediminis]
MARDPSRGENTTTGTGASPPPPARRTEGTIALVQALRFFAALLVVLYHAPTMNPDYTERPSRFDAFHLGGAGVDVFFVISGLVITLTVAKARHFDLADFAARRFWRIFPVYWAFLAATIAVELLSLRVGIGAPFAEAGNPVYIVTSVFLLPLPFQIMEVAWTLGLEITFYLLFALGFRCYGLRGVVAALLLWYAFAVLYVSTPLGDVPALFYLGYPVILEFAFGIAICWLHLNTRMPLGPAALVLGTAAMAGALFAPEVASLAALLHEPELRREFQFGIPAAILVYGAVATPLKVPGWLLLLGQSSYILYLLHSLFFGVARAAVNLALGVELGASDLGVAALIVGAVALSAVLTHTVERPFLLWSRRFVPGYSVPPTGFGAGIPAKRDT